MFLRRFYFTLITWQKKREKFCQFISKKIFFKIQGNYSLILFFSAILSFLRRERESFPLFVSRRYSVPSRTFLGVPDRSALQTFTVPDHLHERSMSVSEAFVTFLRPEESERVLKRSETTRNVGRSGKFRNVKERSRTFRDVGRSEKFAKSWSRYVHVSKTKELRENGLLGLKFFFIIYFNSI